MDRTVAGVITLLIAGVAVWTYRLPTVRSDLHMLGIVTAVNLMQQSMVAAIAVFPDCCCWRRFPIPRKCLRCSWC